MYELTIEREFNCQVEKLYSAWCQPELIQQWFAKGNMSVPEASADVREGGSYLIDMLDPDDDTHHVVTGQYSKVVANEQLDFTWKWKQSPHTTKVSVKFQALENNRSKLTLLHCEFIDIETRDKHEQGWNGCLQNLSKVAA